MGAPFGIGYRLASLEKDRRLLEQKGAASVHFSCLIVAGAVMLNLLSKCRSARRWAQTSFGLIGSRLFAQRSGTACWMRCQFGDAVAGCPATWGRAGFAGTLFSRSPTEAGPRPAERLVASALAGSKGAWLWNQSVDHSPHCRVSLGCSITATMLAA